MVDDGIHDDDFGSHVVKKRILSQSTVNIALSFRDDEKGPEKAVASLEEQINY